MSSFTRHLIRLALDASSFEPPQDVLRAGIPALWSGRDVDFQLGLFDHGELVDINRLATFTLTLKRQPEDRSVPSWDDAVYLTRTQEVADREVTDTEWTEQTDAHLGFSFSGDETQLEPGT